MKNGHKLQSKHAKNSYIGKHSTYFYQFDSSYMNSKEKTKLTQFTFLFLL